MFFANNRGEMAPDNGGGFTPPTYLQQRTPTQAPPSQPQTEPTFSAPGAGTAQTGFRAPVDEGGGEVLPKDGQTPFPQQSPQTYNPVAAPPPMPIEHAPPPSPAFTPQPPTPVQQEIQPEQQLAASGRNVYDAPPPSAFTPVAPTPVAEPIAPPAQIAPAPQASFTPQAPTPVMQPANPVPQQLSMTAPAGPQPTFSPAAPTPVAQPVAPTPQQLSMLASAPQEGGMAPTNTNGLAPQNVSPIAPAAAGGANTNFSPAAGGAGTAPQTPAVAPQNPGFGQLGQMILDRLKNPSSYDTSTMQNAIANNEAQLKTQEDAGLSGVDADMAARGLLMGSPDVIDRSKIRNNIQQARSNFDTNITMDRAHTMAADNAQAFGNAFNFVGQGQQQQQLDNGQQFNWAQLAAELGNLNAPNPNSALGSMPMSQPNFGGIDPATLQAIGALFAKQGGNAPAAGSGNSPVSGASIY